MKKEILSIAFASFACLLAAKPIGDQPKVHFQESQFSQHSYFTIGDSIVTERELVRLVRNSTAYFTLGRPGFTGFLRLVISETLH